MQPTQEQSEAIELFKGGLNFVIQAGAGVGKTSVLQMMAESTNRTGQYLVFNKSLSMEAGRRFPGNVRTNTVHSVAFRAVGTRYAHRLEAPRMRSMDIARLLGIGPLVVDYDGKKKVLQPSYLGSLVMRSLVNFCYSAEKEPGPEFVPYVAGIDMVDIGGRRSWDNNRQVRQHVATAIQRAWVDALNVDGRLPFRHDSYLKIFELSNPRMPVDFVLLDEAQDTNGVTLSLFEQQEHAQRVLVGDDQQSIYGWRAANINALQIAKADALCYLTKSWRFGPPIADVANVILDQLNADLRLTGNDEVESEVASVDRPSCILSRTNAVAMRNVLRLLREGARVHLVGGGDELVRFAKAVVDLQDTGSSYHPELACFTSYGELLAYVEQDPSGDELALLVKLCEEFSPALIIDGLAKCSSEQMADVVISTVHKSKGRQFPSVQLAEDFPEDPEDEELRLLYVAATRAQFVLDVDRCVPLRRLLTPRLVESPPVVLTPQ